jgi:hypothetical protein
MIEIIVVAKIEKEVAMEETIDTVVKNTKAAKMNEIQATI